jgi:hypothetical protein
MDSCIPKEEEEEEDSMFSLETYDKTFSLLSKTGLNPHTQALVSLNVPSLIHYLTTMR